MSKEKYLSYYRQQSNILNPPAPGPSNCVTPLQPGNLRNLTSSRLEIAGNPSGENKGFYLDTMYDEWKTSSVTLVKNQIKILERQFLQFQDDELALGNQKPTVWPTDLQEARDKLEAQLIIYGEELKLIDRLIQEVEEAAKLERERLQPMLGPVKNWRRQEFSNGRLQSVAGQRLSADSEGVLFIDEPKSPFHKMYVFEWKVLILRPLMRQYNYLTREEFKKEPSDRQPVKWPAAPIRHASGTIEYPGYNPQVLKNLGIQ